MTNEQAHRMAREKGVSPILYALIRAVLTPLFRIWFRMRISGAEHIPAEGAAIVAPNHKSFFDSFFIALATHRRLRFMGKSELFEGRAGRLFVRLGAFPVRRGKSDGDALETAREVLRQGELLALFPEGTRVREPRSLGEPHRGAGRLALETGAPLIPAAITGTDHLWLGPLPKPKRVQIAFSKAIAVDHLPATPAAAGELIEETLWPQVEGEFGRLLSRPGLIAAGIAALGAGAGGVALGRRRSAARRRRRGLGRLGRRAR